jgi:periplasmic nitrate reductase NapD
MRMTRRALLRGDTDPLGVHISSLVVHCRQEAIPSLIGQINALPEADVPEHSPEGKLVVLLETANEAVIMDRISVIEQFPGVISVALVYHQIDTDMESTT